MSVAGDIFENPVTGECGYVRVGTVGTYAQYMMVDLRVKPGGAVLGEHIHKTLYERFTVLQGMIGHLVGAIFPPGGILVEGVTGRVLVADEL